MVKTLTLMFTATILLAACGTSGTHVKTDGTSDRLRWPNPEEVGFNKGRGTFPKQESLNKIRSGMIKDQLYNLIGRPQFGEGFRVREWDYLFHFNTPNQGTDGVTTCQYKILFDKQKYARSFHWKAVDPVDAVCPPVAEMPKI